MEFKIVKEKKALLDEFYGIAVEQIIRTNSEYINAKHISGNFFKDFPKGVFGMNEEIQEVPNEGTIIYQTPTGTITFNYYLGIVKLSGFDEEKSKRFLEIKSDLEEVIKANSGKELIDKFTGKYFKKQSNS